MVVVWASFIVVKGERHGWVEWKGWMGSIHHGVNMEVEGETEK